MRNLFIALILLFGGFLDAGAQIPYVQAKQIDQWRHAQTDSVYVINFWATWCVPCVEEMPDLIRLQANYGDRKVKLILVSNDFKKNVASKLLPFVQEHGIQQYAVFMNEPTPNKWINTVTPDWSGGIPATWIVRPSDGKEAFHEGKMDYEALEGLLLSVLDH